MRIGVRRLRACLSLARKGMATARVEPLRVELRWLAQTLGPARDLDVFATSTLPAVRDAVAQGGNAASLDTPLAKLATRTAVWRKDAHTIIVWAPGYQSLQFDYLAVWDGASLPNIAAPGGSAMFATDTATGADKSFYPLDVVKLEKTAAPTSQPTMLYERRGKLMTKDVYDHALENERKYRDSANEQ